MSFVYNCAARVMISTSRISKALHRCVSSTELSAYRNKEKGTRHNYWKRVYNKFIAKSDYTR